MLFAWLVASQTVVETLCEASSNPAFLYWSCLNVITSGCFDTSPKCKWKFWWSLGNEWNLALHGRLVDVAIVVTGLDKGNFCTPGSTNLGNFGRFVWFQTLLVSTKYTLS